MPGAHPDMANKAVCGMTSVTAICLVMNKLGVREYGSENEQMEHKETEVCMLLFIFLGKRH